VLVDHVVEIEFVTSTMLNACPQIQMDHVVEVEPVTFFSNGDSLTLEWIM